MLVSEFDQQKSELRCKECDMPGRLVRYSKPPHIGVRCENCDCWQFWLKQDHNPVQDSLLKSHTDLPIFKLPTQKEIDPRYTPHQIRHPQTLEERVASLEHDVSILAQLMTGKKRSNA